MILIIDNYDSFTYNLYQYIGMLNKDIKVVRNDKTDMKAIEKDNPSHIVISPGPGFPSSAGISKKVIKHFYNKIPILGVCLGHQAIGEVFGARIVHANKIHHGKASEVTLSNSSLYKGLPDRIKVARYHSLIIDKSTLPDELIINAVTNEGEIMGIHHKEYPLYGVQFHPESIITEHGLSIIKNFLKEETVCCN